jgi:hypothetical protein
MKKTKLDIIKEDAKWMLKALLEVGKYAEIDFDMISEIAYRNGYEIDEDLDLVEIEYDDYISDDVREVLVQYKKDKEEGKVETVPLRDLRKENEIFHTHIKIDLSISELERISNGYVVQTQYPWLTIGSK